MAIITISRGTYSGGLALAESLSEDLGYRLLSREQLLTNAAKEFGALEDDLKSALQQRPGFLEGRGRRKLQYVYCVQAAIAKAVQNDNVVYHGQAGHLLLRGIPHHLRLRAVADMEYRITDTVKRGNFTREEAIQCIEELDRERANWMKWLHGVDPNDPTTYDLEINLEHISIPTACMIVAQTVNHGFQTTPESQQMLDNLVLTSDIRAKMGLLKEISDDRIEVEARDGIVTITANVRFLADANRVRELVAQIPGVKDIQSKIEIGKRSGNTAGPRGFRAV